MKRRLSLWTTILMAAPLASSDAAQGPDDITPLYALALVAPAEQTVTTCEGVDGTYTLVHIKGTGPVSATDPRLNGTFHADALVFSRPDGRGLGFDRLTITDADGRVLARGLATAMDLDPIEPIKGQVTAKLADGTRLWAMSTVRLPAPGSGAPIIIEFGGAGSGDIADRALTIDSKGECAKIFFDAYYD